MLKKKKIWITGASSGIGAALAKEFSAEGVTLILSARNRENLLAVKKNCSPASEIIIESMDVSKHDLIPAIVEKILQKVGSIDILINNAGISQRTKVEDSDLSIDKKIFDVNFFGALALTRALLPQFIAQKSGNIVVISSLVGKFATPQRSAYAASKHALHGWFDALRAEIYDRGISVNLICPGYVQTQISVNAATATGKHGKMDKSQANGISAEQCAKEILEAIRKNKSEVYIGGKETIYVKVKRFFPAYFEKRIRTFVPS